MFPTKLPRRVMLLSTVFNRTLKLGDFSADAAADARVVDAVAADAGLLDVDAAVPAASGAAVFRVEDVEAAAASAACFRTG